MAQSSAVSTSLLKIKDRNSSTNSIAKKIAGNNRITTLLDPDTTVCLQPETAGTIQMMLPAVSVADSLLADSAAVANAGIIEIEPIPIYYLTPAVFDRYRILTPDSLMRSTPALPESAAWLARQLSVRDRMTRTLQDYFLNHSTDVKYNLSWMPAPPKKFETVIDPTTQRIEVREVKIDPNAGQNLEAEKVDRRHWMHNFSASLQYSQAYVSPNWYQGGNRNMNLLGHVIWNVKLNQNYHPKLLFENTVQYKLGFNNAPNDTIREYAISDDLFQLNTTFGYKAAKSLYYSTTLQFRTQLFHAYKSNTNDLRSAFLSPGELNIGIGMTYNYVNQPKTVFFDASVNPLAYNLKICINDRLNPESYGIKLGKHSISTYGSSLELKFRWVMAYNISYQSRVFAFTDYETAYADWENTLSFAVNRFLSTEIYFHLRYDTAKPNEDSSWHKLQFKEILSFGFSYKFSTI